MDRPLLLPDASLATATPAPTPPPPPESDLTLRRFLESAILFGIVVLTLRALTLEPFGVPTGSMAHTMLGNHKACDCPRCGFHVVVGSGNNGKNDAQTAERAYATAWCPNCGQGDLNLQAVRETTGDRLLVDKNVYEMRRPRRWEVAVFRNPSDMSKPYVKRVVGLPGERVQIRDGDVIIDGAIARKTLAETRAMRVLVFDHSFAPPNQWSVRWRRVGTDPVPSDLRGDKSPLSADEHLDGTTLKWSGGNSAMGWLAYRHWLLDEGRVEPIRDWFAYNGAGLQQELHEVHDFSVEFMVEANGPGVVAVRLTDGQNTVAVEIPVLDGSQPAATARLIGVEHPTPVQPWAHLKSGQKHRVEFVFVDRRVMLSIDDREAFAPVDLPEAAIRRGVSQPLALGAQGSEVRVSNLRLYRDVHYSPSGRNGIHEAWPLGDDEYFMLGDNSTNSEDSRFWTRPGVPESHFLGRPLLLHQPSHWSRVGGWELQALDWQRIQWIR